MGDHLSIERARSPEPQGMISKKTAAAEIDQLLEDDQRRIAGDVRKLGVAGGEIDRGAGQHQLADLGGKARRIHQRHPAALTQADEIYRAAERVRQYVEIGEIVVDRQEAHVRTCRAPIRDKDALYSGILQ